MKEIELLVLGKNDWNEHEELLEVIGLFSMHLSKLIEICTGDGHVYLLHFSLFLASSGLSCFTWELCWGMQAQ